MWEEMRDARGGGCGRAGGVGRDKGVGARRRVALQGGGRGWGGGGWGGGVKRGGRGQGHGAGWGGQTGSARNGGAGGGGGGGCGGGGGGGGWGGARGARGDVVLLWGGVVVGLRWRSKEGDPGVPQEGGGWGRWMHWEARGRAVCRGEGRGRVVGAGPWLGGAPRSCVGEGGWRTGLAAGGGGGGGGRGVVGWGGGGGSVWRAGGWACVRVCGCRWLGRTAGGP